MEESGEMYTTDPHKLPGRVVCGIPLFVLGCVSLTSLTSILLGYDIGIMSTAKDKMAEDFEFSTFQEEVCDLLGTVADYQPLVLGGEKNMDPHGNSQCATTVMDQRCCPTSHSCSCPSLLSGASTLLQHLAACSAALCRTNLVVG
eukprot:m.352192 g.352192  ORF g.352192 m.352192 type:complete len:145 (+) comp19900_c2_seq15:99-533(+)